MTPSTGPIADEKLTGTAAMPNVRTSPASTPFEIGDSGAGGDAGSTSGRAGAGRSSTIWSSSIRVRAAYAADTRSPSSSRLNRPSTVACCR